MSRQLTAFVLLFTFALPTLGHSGHPEADASNPASTTETSPPKERVFLGKGKPPPFPVSAYKPDEVLGWGLLVHEDLIADEELHKKVLAEIHHQLYLIDRTLPADKVKLLKEVPIWVELNNPYSDSAQYHSSAKWLAGHGYLPEKANGVEISNARSFIRRWAHHKSNVMMHEFAHAYHDMHLSFDREDIVKSFEQAEASGTYDEVQHVSGRLKRHYAMTDHKEYFAECTEAFFGCNDHFPFVRPELKKHDPEAYRIIKEVWGVKR